MLLPPDGRSLLTDALRPPPGFQLSRAVATTFTLELDSLLAAPLAFAAHSMRESENPIAVMDGVRRCADRVDVFCQAGQIAPPPTNSNLLLLLEPIIHPVRQPRPGRLFHPKLWVLRYDNGYEQQLRLIVLSRNLTTDRSWDVSLRLDGGIGNRRDSTNRPIVDLLNHTLGMVTQPVPTPRRREIDSLIEDLRRAQWEPPPGFREMNFYALGVPRSALPDFTGSRHLIVSPFIEPGGLARCAPDAGDLTVIGRQEELDGLPEGALDGCKVLVINELAAFTGEDEAAASRLTGLHAKVYVVEYGRRAHVFVGSANATQAAFHGNVELLVELIGSRQDLGIDAMVGERAPFRGILEEYERRELTDTDDGAEWALEEYLRGLATAPFVATVAGPDEPYELHVTCTEQLPPLHGGRLTIGLLTRPSEQVQLVPGEAVEATFRDLGTTELTRFLVVTAEDKGGTRRRAVVLARLVGDPADRLDRVLAEQVNTPEKFLQFLMLLLGLGVPGDAAMIGGSADGTGTWVTRSGNGVLELLLNALAERPGQLDDLARLVERMATTEQGLAVLPDGFLELWRIVDEVRRDQVKVPS
jgi:hypothetical protein